MQEPPAEGLMSSTGRRGPPQLQLAVMELGSMSEPGQGSSKAGRAVGSIETATAAQRKACTCTG